MTVLWALAFVWLASALLLLIVVWDCQRAERIKDAETEKAYAEAIRKSFAAVEARLEAHAAQLKAPPLPPPPSETLLATPHGLWRVTKAEGSAAVYQCLHRYA